MKHHTQKLVFTAIIAGINILSVPSVKSADEVISGEEALTRKIREHAKGAADSKIIRVRTMSGRPLAPVVVRDSPEEVTPLSQEDEDRLLQRERWSSKEKVTILFTATVYDDRYTELQWWNEGTRLRAFVNADVRDLQSFSVIETKTKVFFPGILVMRSDGDLARSSGIPSVQEIASMNSNLEYLVGYAPNAELGTPEDYHCLEAILKELSHRTVPVSDE